jgi:hypothetical protein
MQISCTYTVCSWNVEWRMDGIVKHVFCKHLITVCVFDNSIHSPFMVLTAYSIRVWHLHPFSIPRVKCLQYTCVTSPSILHSTCKRNGEWMELSHTYTVSILHVEWRMYGDVIHVYCSIFHSTCKMLTVYVCDISIHSPFHGSNAYSIRAWHLYAFSIPRVEYCKHFKRGMENGWRCHTRIL